MKKWKTLLVFGCVHYLLQLSVFVIGFAVGPGKTTREILDISLYEIASVLTFPFVYLFEKFHWSGLGLSAFFLNSLVWTMGFYLILMLIKFASKKRHHHG